MARDPGNQNCTGSRDGPWKPGRHPERLDKCRNAGKAAGR